MNHPFLYSDTNKRCHTYSYYLKRRYGGRAVKITLDGGFTCPNIDGTLDTGGCTFCSAQGSGEFAGDRQASIPQQFAQVVEKLSKKWDTPRYIAYFQPFTNTYGPLERLRAAYEQALALPGVVGLAIATRPDCLPEPVLDLLSELSARTDLTVELGLQTIWEETSRRIHRHHSYEQFLQGYHALTQRGIAVCVHLINGLPGETPAQMVESARQVGKLHPHSVKLHLLHVLKNTQLAEEYAAGDFSLLTREAYVSIVCDQLEVLPPETVIQRLTGDGKAADLIGPLWSIAKMQVMNEIDKEMARRESWQGKYFSDN